MAEGLGMARRERFSRAQFALWPDEGLLAAAATLTGRPVIYRAELNFRGPVNLTVDFSDHHYFPPSDPDAALNAGSHRRMLRLEWADTWEEGGHRGNRIFALESYDEFYAGPFGTFHPTRQGIPQSYFYEVVNEPDPWIAEILDENENTDIFPPYGEPALMSERARRLNPHLRETGRFFPGDAPRKASGSHTDFFWTGPQPPAPGEWEAALAQAKAKQQADWEAQKRRPRYRHLLIASESHFLEILCEDLPRWAWVGEGLSGT